ncbi:MAG: hypothetical protein PHS02_02750 [Candidatus ainarchaeum sp.]|nr:hypothetical protein [Candidatus ainarchaeum sp.]
MTLATVRHDMVQGFKSLKNHIKEPLADGMSYMLGERGQRHPCRHLRPKQLAELGRKLGEESSHLAIHGAYLAAGEKLEEAARYADLEANRSKWPKSKKCRQRCNELFTRALTCYSMEFTHALRGTPDVFTRMIGCARALGNNEAVLTPYRIFGRVPLYSAAPEQLPLIYAINIFERELISQLAVQDETSAVNQNILPLRTELLSRMLKLNKETVAHNMDWFASRLLPFSNRLSRLDRDLKNFNKIKLEMQHALEEYRKLGQIKAKLHS